MIKPHSVIRSGQSGKIPFFHLLDRLHLIRMRLHIIKHAFRRNHGAQLSLGNVPPLVGRAQLVHHHKILFTGFFQSGDNV